MNHLQNEPGFENYEGPLSIDYKNIVTYDAIYSLFYRNTKYLIDDFLIFQKIIIDNYKNNKDKIIEKINKLENKEYKISVNIYRINMNIDYNNILSKLNKFDI